MTTTGLPLRQPAARPAPRAGVGSSAAGMLRRLHGTEPLLVGTSLVLALALVPFAILWVVDPRVIAGAPAWLKPAKFAASTALYTLTLAFVFTWLPARLQLRRVVGRITAVVLPLEVAVIAIQAARGTTSHFNVGTPVDGVLFGVMGVAIAVQTVASVAVAVALWREHIADPAMRWALRAGMTLTIAGAAVGGLMTSPTPTQQAEAAATGRMTTAGAHTVGAPDGGPGLPVTGWSTEAGDLRVPHFVGLHALQVLIIGAWLLRRRSEGTRGRGVLLGAAVWAGLFVLLLAQAIAGRPLLPLP